MSEPTTHGGNPARDNEQAFPRRNERLVAEVRYIAHISNHMRFGDPDFRRIAKEVGETVAGSRMSEEGLTGIMVEGTNPRIPTLRDLATYARRFDPQYSVTRLFVAAGYESEEDVRLYAQWRWPLGWVDEPSAVPDDLSRARSDLASTTRVLDVERVRALASLARLMAP